MATTRKTSSKPEDSTDLVKSIEALLPDLAQTDAGDFSIDAGDITPPRIKAASPTTGAAANGLVPNYSLFSQKGRDDEEPVLLVEAGPGGKADLVKDPDYGLKVYVLRMYKTRAANVDPNDWQRELKQNQGGEFRVWGFDDQSAPPFARTQYNYVVYVPESPEPDMPHNLLLANTSVPTARFMNTLLAKHQRAGRPVLATALRIWPEKREREADGQTQRWAIIRAREVDADVFEVQQAAELASMLAPQRNATGAAPQEDFRVADQAPAI